VQSPAFLNGENLFEEITGVLSPIPFCSMFRMNRYSFERRCEYIIVKIGGNVFKLQEWLVLVEGQQSVNNQQGEQIVQPEEQYLGILNCNYATHHGWSKFFGSTPHFCHCMGVISYHCWLLVATL
jgi:hypothetical protein